MWGLSSLTRNQTYVPCIAKQILNHWTTGKSLCPALTCPLPSPSSSHHIYGIAEIRCQSIVLLYLSWAADVIVCQRENYTYSSIQRSFNNIWLILIIIANINPIFHREFEDKGSPPLPHSFPSGGTVPTRSSSCKKLLATNYQKPPPGKQPPPV